MALVNFILFITSLFFLVRSATYAMRYSAKLAKFFHLSEFVVSFFIVAVISTFPEMTVAIVSALEGVPEFGMGTLLGSNITDLTLVLGLVALFSLKGVRVKSEILKEDYRYLLLLLFPVMLGLDGRFSRLDGVLLVAAGVFFFLTLSIESKMFRRVYNHRDRSTLMKNLVLLVISLAALLISASYTVKFGVHFAEDIQIPPMLVGLVMISIGSCMPELMFSLRAVRTKHDEMALGDILGTVITDATIILGATIIISPFSFQPLLIYVTGFAMFLAGLMAVLFITSGKILTKKEGLYLLFFYIIYLITESLVNNLI
ncbi:MAG: sodium:calcium antiporter [Candidatus Altiarchaeota archaeon]|nr:sodium:calcium antiporter [Candidatus Altiarchaeota archaeon]